MIRVMIADDHKMVREGLKNLIEFDDNIRVVEEADNGTECIDKLRCNNADVLLLDINMPELSGMEVLETLLKWKTCPRILMLTVHNEIEYLIKSVDMGVDGYLLKDSDSHELIRAIHCVYEGEKFIQPSLIPFLNSKLIARDLDNGKLELLSEREIEVLKLVAAGLLNKDIGSRLFISERTVKNHLSNIFKKIDCSDRTQAAIFCLRNGLASLDG